MSNNKELVETLDFFVKHCQESGDYQDCRQCCYDNMKNCDHSENADLIKLRLKAQPDEELVGKIIDVGYDLGMWIPDKFKQAIHKLLQERK